MTRFHPIELVAGLDVKSNGHEAIETAGVVGPVLVLRAAVHAGIHNFPLRAGFLML